MLLQGREVLLALLEAGGALVLATAFTFFVSQAGIADLLVRLRCEASIGN